MKIKNKKGNLAYGVLAIGLFMLIMVVLMIIGDSEINCIVEEKVIIGINGMTQTDSGLLSDSDIHKTTLLFDDGEVITLSRRVNHIFLGKPTNIEYCETLWFGTSYKVLE